MSFPFKRESQPTVKSAYCSNPATTRQREFLQRFQRFLRSGNSKQFWDIQRSRSACKYSESSWNALPRFFGSSHFMFEIQFVICSQCVRLCCGSLFCVVSSRFQRLSCGGCCLYFITSRRVFGMVSDGLQAQKRGSWIPGKERAERVLANAISIDGRKEWTCKFCAESNVWKRLRCRRCYSNIPAELQREVQRVVYRLFDVEWGGRQKRSLARPMMTLIARSNEGAPSALSSTASESPVKTRQESQSPLSSRDEQHHRTGRPVLDAYSSNYSEWNADKTWSSQEWKSDELMEVRTESPVNEQPPGLFAQHTDRFIVDDDDMDSDTDAEPDMSLKSRSFLHRVNDRVRKRQKQSSMDATEHS